MILHDGKRAAELAKIHIAKKDLGMADDAYRDMLWAVARVRSAGDLDWRGRQLVLDHLKACGFKARAARRSPHPGAPHNLEGNAQLGKVEALLADAGRPWDYADRLARRMYGKERVAFCDGAELQGLITALVKDQRRRRAKAEHETRP